MAVAQCRRQAQLRRFHSSWPQTFDRGGGCRAPTLRRQSFGGIEIENQTLKSARRYEVQGEYVIPSVAALPKSAAEMALMQGASGQGASAASPFEQADGRWRVQVSTV